MESVAGYVYIMINPALDGIVKIGKTRNNPEKRAKELSSATGVPSPFFVAYQAYFKDCNAAEVFVHTLLAKYRLAENREFFRISVRLAIKAVRDAEYTLDVIAEPEFDSSPEIGDISTAPLMPWKAVFHSANAHIYGIGDTIQDQNEALQLYIQAIKLGAVSAYWIIGHMYLWGKGCNQDYPKAKSTFIEGTKHENDLCWTGLAEIYFQEDHFDNWDKCWKKYFDSTFFIQQKKYPEYMNLEEFMSNRAYQIYSYRKQANVRGWQMPQLHLIQNTYMEVEGFMKSNQNIFATIEKTSSLQSVEKQKEKAKKVTQSQLERKLRKALQ